MIDTGSQTCHDLVKRYDAAVVPLTVVVDGEAYLEGEGLAKSTFYEMLAAGADITTAAPAPGQLLTAYEEAAAGGATNILSIHLAATLSGTVNAAQVASEMSPIPVEVLDSDTCAWGVDAIVSAAGDALQSGAEISGAIAAANGCHERLLNLFVVGQPERLRRGGRLQVADHEIESTSLLAARHTDLIEVGKVDTVLALVETTVRFITAETSGSHVRIAVGDAGAPTLAGELVGALQRSLDAEVVRYEMSPSLASHLGSGSVVVTCCPAR